MATKTAGSKQNTVKKAVAGKKRTVRKQAAYPPVLKLPLVGKIKREDIRKAVLRVRDKKAKIQASTGQ
jgi:hypothetical protein